MRTCVALSLLTLMTVSGNAQSQNDKIDMNSEEMVRLREESESRVKNQQKRLSPYDERSRGKALNPMMPDCRDISNYKTIDWGTICILYALNAGAISDPKTYDDLQRLEIGRNMVKYYGYYVYESDSCVTAEML
ncbi:MAG: hypothetical protein Q8914_06365, partial [Bacteroidota bacterium]|nr:hypothetical protein [Bacteroidota bacterium]